MTTKLDEKKRNEKNELGFAKVDSFWEYYSGYNPADELDYLHFVETLLKDGMDINCKLPNKLYFTHEDRLFSGNTLLHMGAFENLFEIVEKLLNQEADFTIQNNEGKTALHLVFNDGKWWTIPGKLERKTWVNSILNAHVSSCNSLNPSCKNGITHLHIACMVDHVEAVKLFLQAGTPVDQSIHIDSPILPGFTPLHIAARYGCLETAKILLDYGVDQDCKNSQGLNPLHTLLIRKVQISDLMLLRHNRYESFIHEKDTIDTFIELFLKFKQSYSINKVDELGISSFHIACTMKDQSVAENLVKQVDINAAVNADSPIFPGYTAAHFSARFMFSTMNLLLKNGVNLLIKDAYGRTPIDLCLERYDPEEFLLHSEIADIVLENSNRDVLTSNKIIKLGDFILSMRSPDEFQSILQQNVNIVISNHSPLWAGYTPMHLMVLFADRYKYMYQMNEQNDNHDWIQFCIENGYDSCKKAVNEYTPLHLAFQLKNKKIIDLLLQQKPLHNPVDSNNLSHFHIACMTKNKEAIENFLKMGVDVNSHVKCDLQWFREINIHNQVSEIIKIRANSTPLHLAVIFENKDVIKLLLDYGADRYAMDDDGLNPIHLAILLKERGSVDLLLSDVNLEDRVAEKYKLSHLHVACAANNNKAINKLLDQGADINLAISPLYPGKFKGQTPLHIASSVITFLNMDSSEKTIKLLISKNANIHTKNTEGKSVVQLLLKRKSHFIKFFKEKFKLDDQIGNGITPLHLACASFDLEWIKNLLENGANVNAKINCDDPTMPGYTPLHVLVDIYCQSPCEKPINFKTIMELLLKHGADVTSVDAKGSTPIHLTHYSVVFSYDATSVNAIRFLLKNQQSYKINPVTFNGLSHLHLACMADETEIIKEFLKNGVDPNESIDPFVKNVGGYAPLHILVENKNVKAIEILLNYGADVSAETRLGDTPLHLVVKEKFERVVEINLCGITPNELCTGGNEVCTKENMTVLTNLIDLLVSNGADLNAKNIECETPLEIWISSGNFRESHIDYFTKLGCSFNVFNPATFEGFIAKMIKNDPCKRLSPNKQIINAIINIPGIENQDENGCNAIHNIVSIYRTSTTTENYMYAIERLLGVGNELDQQDQKGRTPLHLAVHFMNSAAIKSLMILGADLNVIDENGKSPYSYCFELARQIEIEIIKILSIQLQRMLKIGLHVSKLNEQTLRLVMEKYAFVQTELTCDEELSRMANIHFGARWPLKSFLSDLIVDKYLCMPQIVHGTINNFFISANKLQEQYPFYGSFLMLQYRKAKQRYKYWEPAMNAMNLLRVEVPNLCLEKILQYLDNKELIILAQVGEKLIEAKEKKSEAHRE